jgi:hypothetical protein
MKKYLFLAVAGLLSFAACDILDEVIDEVEKILPKEVTVQLKADGAAFEVAGIAIDIVDAAGTASFQEVTNDKGVATFILPNGNYTASATYKTSQDGVRYVYNGSNSAIAITEESVNNFEIALQKVESQQLILKEVYTTGCPKNDSGSYSNDAYIVLYNNSDIEADASNVVFGLIYPANGHATNKYYDAEGKLIYEGADWIPAYSAIWTFDAPVTIPAYSQIVIACFGAIDHTATVNASVNLDNAAYYWMQKNDQFTNAKYVVSENIPATQYLSCTPHNSGNSWVVSNSAPAVFIGKMAKAEVEALVANKDGYDTTCGTTAALAMVKFPAANVIDGVDVWSAANIEKSHARFPSTLNTGYVAITNNLGHTVYRNVDKEATEALEENAGKLVYNYAGGTYDEAAGTGSTDPSGIDAEASIAAGAHIIYSDTNDSGKDFHEKAVQSLKK